MPRNTELQPSALDVDLPTPVSRQRKQEPKTPDPLRFRTVDPINLDAQGDGLMGAEQSALESSLREELSDSVNLWTLALAAAPYNSLTAAALNTEGRQRDPESYDSSFNAMNHPDLFVGLNIDQQRELVESAVSLSDARLMKASFEDWNTRGAVMAEYGFGTNLAVGIATGIFTDPVGLIGGMGLHTAIKAARYRNLAAKPSTRFYAAEGALAGVGYTAALDALGTPVGTDDYIGGVLLGTAIGAGVGALLNRGNADDVDTTLTGSDAPPPAPLLGLPSPPPDVPPTGTGLSTDSISSQGLDGEYIPATPEPLVTPNNLRPINIYDGESTHVADSLRLTEAGYAISLRPNETSSPLLLTYIKPLDETSAVTATGKPLALAAPEAPTATVATPEAPATIKEVNPEAPTAKAYDIAIHKGRLDELRKVRDSFNTEYMSLKALLDERATFPKNSRDLRAKELTKLIKEQKRVVKDYETAMQDKLNVVQRADAEMTVRYAEASSLLDIVNAKLKDNDALGLLEDVKEGDTTPYHAISEEAADLDAAAIERLGGEDIKLDDFIKVRRELEAVRWVEQEGWAHGTAKAHPSVSIGSVDTPNGRVRVTQETDLDNLEVVEPTPTGTALITHPDFKAKPKAPAKDKPDFTVETKPEQKPQGETAEQLAYYEIRAKQMMSDAKLSDLREQLRKQPEQSEADLVNALDRDYLRTVALEDPVLSQFVASGVLDFNIRVQSGMISGDGKRIEVGLLDKVTAMFTAHHEVIHARIQDYLRDVPSYAAFIGKVKSSPILKRMIESAQFKEFGYQAIYTDQMTKAFGATRAGKFAELRAIEEAVADLGAYLQNPKEFGGTFEAYYGFNPADLNVSWIRSMVDSMRNWLHSIMPSVFKRPNDANLGEFTADFYSMMQHKDSAELAEAMYTEGLHERWRYATEAMADVPVTASPSRLKSALAAALAAVISLPSGTFLSDHPQVKAIFSGEVTAVRDLFKEPAVWRERITRLKSLVTESRGKPDVVDLTDLQSNLKASIEYELNAFKFATGTVRGMPVELYRAELSAYLKALNDDPKGVTTRFNELLRMISAEYKIPLNEVAKEFEVSKTPIDGIGTSIIMNYQSKFDATGYRGAFTPATKQVEFASSIFLALVDPKRNVNYTSAAVATVVHEIMHVVHRRAGVEIPSLFNELPYGAAVANGQHVRRNYGFDPEEQVVREHARALSQAYLEVNGLHPEGIDFDKVVADLRLNAKISDITSTSVNDLIVNMSRSDDYSFASFSRPKRTPEEAARVKAQQKAKEIDKQQEAISAANRQILSEAIERTRDIEVDPKKVFKLFNKVPILLSNSMIILQGKSPIFKDYLFRVAEVTTGAYVNNNSAALHTAARRGRYAMEMKAYGNMFRDWAKDYLKMNWAQLRIDIIFKGKAFTDFNIQLSEYRRSLDPASSSYGKITNVHPAIKAANDALTNGYKVMLEEQIAAKVEGYQRLDDALKAKAYEHYHPRQMNKNWWVKATDSQKTALAEAMAQNLIDVWGKQHKQLAISIARNYMSRMTQSAYKFAAVHDISQLDAGAIRNLLRAQKDNVDDTLVDALMAQLSVKGAKHTFQRLPLDLSRKIKYDNGKEFSMSDAFDNDQSGLYMRYSRRVGGQVGQALAGISGMSVLQHMKLAALEAPMEYRPTQAEIDAFDMMVNEFNSVPFGTQIEPLDNLMTMARATMLGASVLANLMDFVNTAGQTGVRNFYEHGWKHGRRLAREGKNFKGDYSDPILGSVEQKVGIFGFDVNMSIPHLETDYIANQTANSMNWIQRTINSTSTYSAKLQGYYYLHLAQQRMAARVNILNIFDVLSDAVFTQTPDGMTVKFADRHNTTMVKHLTSSGVTPEFLYKLYKQKSNVATYGDRGYLSRLDITAVVGDNTLADEFANVVNRLVKRQVQGTFIGETAKFSAGTMGRMLTQFRSIAITAMEKQMFRQYHTVGAASFAGSLIGLMPLAIPIYFFRAYLTAGKYKEGTEEWDKYWEKASSPLAIAKGLSMLMIQFGLLADVMDASAWLSGNLLTGYQDAEGNDIGETIKLAASSSTRASTSSLIPVLSYGDTYIKAMQGLISTGDVGKFAAAHPILNVWQMRPLTSAASRFAREDDLEE